MKSTDKTALLNLLRHSGDWLTLAEIVDATGGDLPERTARRWLQELSGYGLVEVTGKTKGRKYRSKVEPADHRVAEPSDLDLFQTESQRYIQQVRQPLYTRQPVSYRDDWLESYAPNQTQYLSNAQLSAMAAKGARRLVAPAGTYARKILNRLIIDLSFNSSRLEGNTYSELDTERLLLQGESPEGKLNEEKIMILNHREAIRYLVENVNQAEINFDTLCTLHYLLADGLVPAGEAGHVRSVGVRIGASTYIPLEGQSRLTARLKRITDLAGAINNPFEQSFFLLVHIAYLQAFTDVNKRTSRLAANFPFIRHNLVPLSFLDVNTNDYISALIAIYELNQTAPLADLFTWSYLRGCERYDATAESVGYDEIRVRYRTQRRAILQHIILHKLYGQAMSEYINEQAQCQVADMDRSDFLEDIREDLELLSPITIAGLGITKEQLLAWQSGVD